MANEHNLIPIQGRNKQEIQDMGRKGGLASGRARRQKAELRQAFQTLLTAEVNNEQMKALLVNFHNISPLVSIPKILQLRALIRRK